MLKDKTTPLLKKRLIASLVLLIPLMYVSMGHMMWNWPLPSFLTDNHVAMGLVQLLLTAIDHGDQSEVFYQWLQELVASGSEHGHAGGARCRRIVWIQCVCAVCDDRTHRCAGIWHAVMGYMHEFYFESAAMILTLITVGKMLEARSKGTDNRCAEKC